MSAATGFFTHARVPDANLHPDTPETPERLAALEERMIALGLDDFVEHFEGAAASEDELALAHDREYVAALYKLCSGELPASEAARFDLPDTKVGPNTFESAALSAGCAIAAVRTVMSGRLTNAFCGVRPPGHHAGRAYAGGFCFFNNVAVAAKFAKTLGLTRIAILDFDAHHGDGTEDIVAGDEAIRYWSLFQWPFYPGKRREPAPANCTQSPLPAGADGAALRKLFENEWLPALSAYRPELIILSAGFDAHTEETMAQLKFSEVDYAYMTRTIAEVAQVCCGGRIVSVLEGGYNVRTLSRCAIVHLQTLVRAARGAADATNPT